MEVGAKVYEAAAKAEEAKPDDENDGKKDNDGPVEGEVVDDKKSK